MREREKQGEREREGGSFFRNNDVLRRNRNRSENVIELYLS